jgi:serralysin
MSALTSLVRSRSAWRFLTVGVLLAGGGIFVRTLSGQDRPAPTGEQPALIYSEWAAPLTVDEDHGLLTVCFDEIRPPSADFIREMMKALAEAGRVPGDEGEGIAYWLGGRWSGGQGNPRKLTWSFVPDGLSISNGIGEGVAPSSLFATLDARFSSQGGRATWIQRFEQCFQRWSEISGTSYERVTYNGQDWDDGASWGSSGSTGLRGDIRICMKPIDGSSGVLAYNYFPSNGDMVLDSAESWGSTSNQNRFLRNIVMHEHGHGLGMEHVCSNNASFLMEPFLSTSFDGPRHDDIRGVQRHYGDPREADDSFAAANFIGIVTPGNPVTNVCDLPLPLTGTNPTNSSNCTIDANGEQDWFSFEVSGAVLATVTVTPVGFTYDDNRQNQFDGSCPSGSSTDSLRRADLAVQLIDRDGTSVLATADSQPLGVAETLTQIPLPVAGVYFIRVYEFDSPSQTQMYTLAVSVEDAADCPGDLNGDKVVDLSDLAILLAAFGISDAGDIDGDGDTDLADLAILLSHWGATC